MPEVCVSQKLLVTVAVLFKPSKPPRKLLAATAPVAKLLAMVELLEPTNPPAAEKPEPGTTFPSTLPNA